MVGLGLMTPFALQAILDYRIACVYQQTECEILGERSFTMSHLSALGGRWMEAHHAHTVFRWAYQVQGKSFSAEDYDNHEGIMADDEEMPLLKKGDKHACWYDPAAPEKSVLVRRFRAKFYLGALIPGSFVLLGGFFLRGAFRRKPQQSDTFISQGEHRRGRGVQPDVHCSCQGRAQRENGADDEVVRSRQAQADQLCQLRYRLSL